VTIKKTTKIKIKKEIMICIIQIQMIAQHHVVIVQKVETAQFLKLTNVSKKKKTMTTIMTMTKWECENEK